MTSMEEFTTWQTEAGLTNIKDVDKADKGITTWEIATLYHLANAHADLSRVYFVFGAYNLKKNVIGVEAADAPKWRDAKQELNAHADELATKTYTVGSWVTKDDLNDAATTAARIWIWENKPQPSCQNGAIPYIWHGEEVADIA